jgi:hypothetical protein
VSVVEVPEALASPPSLSEPQAAVESDRRATAATARVLLLVVRISFSFGWSC